MERIDFVVPWVDGSDPEWRKLKNKYSNKEDYGNNDERFRDWELLKYWFRGVEKYAPWVNKIYFITCGHLPSWLNIDHPKIQVVKHDDYIPEQYLPTFSANPIELNIHRIKGLSEQFVYFNDDLLIIDKVSPEDFFAGGVPKSTAGLAIPGAVRPEFGSTLLTDYDLINRNFNSRQVIKKHFWKFVNYRYGIKRNIQSLLLLPYCAQFFPGFYNAHSPNAFLKSTLYEVWEKAFPKLDESCSNKFRAACDANQYVFLWWQWCKGLISPCDIRKLFTYLTVLRPDEDIVKAITNQVTPMIAINDTWCEDFEKKKKTVHDALDTVLGEKSSFEL